MLRNKTHKKPTTKASRIVKAKHQKRAPRMVQRRTMSQIGEGSDAAFQPQKKTEAPPVDADEDLMLQIDHVVKTYPVVLFMKGTPDRPMCGFSSRVVQMLSKLQVSYESCNVLDSAELREGIKTYSNWPTLPQLYIGGEFVGGCDIVTQMFTSGELQEMLPKNVETTTTPESTTQAV